MSSEKPVIALVVGSTRTHRFADTLLPWFVAQLGARDDLTLSVIDIRDHQLPLFDKAGSPARLPRQYDTPEEEALGKLFDAADGYLVLAAEYNHGYTPGLKNALDSFHAEFNRKAMAFAGYGNAGGARAIEQLRQVAVELELAPTRFALHIPGALVPDLRDPEESEEAFASLVPRLAPVLDDLVWWTNALRAAR